MIYLRNTTKKNFFRNSGSKYISFKKGKYSIKVTFALQYCFTRKEEENIKKEQGSLITCKILKDEKSFGTMNR